MVSHVIPRAEPLMLGRQICGSWETASRYEWLVTNGLGGYAAGTVALGNTRRYHGFLMASLSPPVERTLLVSKIEIAADYRGKHLDLTSNEFAGGAISPQGFVHLESFAIRTGIPTWHYAVGDALLETQIFMADGANTSYLRMEVLRASAPLRVSLKPFVTYRDYHGHARGAHPFGLQSESTGCHIQPPGPARAFRLLISQGSFTAEPHWYWNFWHREEYERGLDAVEDLWVPGFFTVDLQVHEPVFLTATCETSPPPPGAEALGSKLADSRRQLAAIPKTAPDWIGSLTLAADQFLVRRGAGTEARSVIAGYPWFADWGRDTMIALPGLATALGRYDIAAAIITTYAGFVDRGMLPNRFPDAGGAPPQYNTADATLWLFHALDDYLQARRDPQLAQQLLPTLMSIIQAHLEGTRYGIQVDPADGLLHAGEAGSQVTWMDAKHGEEVFTPRVGKPVEINALWLTALEVTARLAGRNKMTAEKKFCLAWLERAQSGFSRFWNAQKNCLYDVIDRDGGTDHDDRVRPNQIFAVSLPCHALTVEQMRAVVDLCGRELLTSYGLRSLGPNEPGYIGRYAGDARQRDAAYHMGTAWGWLLGPYARAHFRVYRNAGYAQSLLDPIAQHVHSACLGTVSEIFDGDAPHTARGCFAQAWSVAEILRAWLFLERSADHSRTSA